VVVALLVLVVLFGVVGFCGVSVVGVGVGSFSGVVGGGVFGVGGVGGVGSIDGVGCVGGVGGFVCGVGLGDCVVVGIAVIVVVVVFVVISAVLAAIPVVVCVVRSVGSCFVVSVAVNIVCDRMALLVCPSTLTVAFASGSMCMLVSRLCASMISSYLFWSERT